MPTILAFGTYPIRKPVHGGQRRVTELKRFYEGLGLVYRYACLYGKPYTAADVEADDLPFDAAAADLPNLPFVDDLASGMQAAGDNTYPHFKRVSERVRPDAFAIEHPFMLPLVERLRSEDAFASVPLIYSSHNVEAPLKASILRKYQVNPAQAEQVVAAIEEVEHRAVRDAALTIAVSRSDQAHYEALVGRERVCLVPNGVERPRPKPFLDLDAVFGKRPFAYVVGSAYPPNIEGFLDVFLKDGPHFLPPKKSIAVCGGMASGVFGAGTYQRFARANGDRVHFFPDISDEHFAYLRERAAGAILPITFGGGSNLKTAEALSTGCWVVATSTALRGYESFRDDPGVVVTDDPAEFRRATARVLRSEPPRLTQDDLDHRDGLFWDRAIVASGLERMLARILPSLGLQ